MSAFAIGDQALGGAGDVHPLWILGHASMDGWRVVGASSAGRYHTLRGLPRDDAFACRAARGWVAMVVCDGVGSRPLSRYGASYTADMLARHLLRQVVPKPTLAAPPGRPPGPVPAQALDEPELPAAYLRQLPEGLLRTDPNDGDHTIGSLERARPESEGDEIANRAGTVSFGTNACPWSDAPAAAPVDTPELEAVAHEAFKAVHMGLRDQARGLNLELADLGCTALAVLYHPGLGGGVAAQIGDGWILGLGGSQLEIIQAPDDADPQTTATITSSSFASKLRVATIGPVDSILLMTDGIANDVMFGAPELWHRWASLVVERVQSFPRAAQASADLLHTLATLEIHGSWDDRTLLLLTRTADGHR